MHKFSDEFVQRLIVKSPIVPVISEYGILLRRSGFRYTALCPFHTEKVPSFVANPNKNTWRCYGCGEQGNSITFVQVFENISFSDAVRKLAKRAGLDIDDLGLDDGLE